MLYPDQVWQHPTTLTTIKVIRQLPNSTQFLIEIVGSADSREIGRRSYATASHIENNYQKVK
jgi:hypothetical protein